MKQAVIDWYNRRIVAAWYRSWTILVALVAAGLPYLVDGLQGLLDNLGVFGNAFELSPATVSKIQFFLLVVVLPAARAWRQRSMTEAAEKQKAIAKQ